MMWQIYAMVARDILEDRRREAAETRRYHAPVKPHRSTSGRFKRIVTGRGED